MARNEERRATLTDAGISVLATEGARGLTHRAVDARADVPRGTTSNYFATRDDLIAALVDRIAVRLTPAPDAVDAGAEDLTTAYVRDVVRRLDADPHVPLALFELRLEAARRPSVAESLGAWRQRAFEDDVTFNEKSGLPGRRADLALLHFAIDGFMLDRLTVPLGTGLAPEDAVAALVARLIPNP